MMRYRKRRSGLIAPERPAFFIPGYFPPGAAGGGGAAGLTTLSFVTSTTSEDSSTVTAPGTVNPGDILVYFDYTSDFNSSPAAAVTPSGFTNHVSVALSSSRLMISTKLAVGTEDSASITGMTQDGINSGGGKAILQFRGDATVASLNIVDVSQEMTDGNPTSQSITAGSGTAPLIVIAAYSCNKGIVDPRTFSTTADGEVEFNSTNFSVDATAAYKIYNSSPADTTIDQDDEGFENALAGFYIEAS